MQGFKTYKNRGGGGYYGFQVTGMTEGFFWVCNFRFQDIFGKDYLASIFTGWLVLSRDFWGIQNHLRIRGSAAYDKFTWCYEERNTSFNF